MTSHELKVGEERLRTEWETKGCEELLEQWEDQLRDEWESKREELLEKWDMESR
jgi:hypothetical protein